MWLKRNFEYEVEDVFSLVNGGAVVVGHVKSGTMYTGDKAWLLKKDGTKLGTRIMQMETHGATGMMPLKKASKNAAAGVRLEGIQKNQVDIGDHLMTYTE